MTTGSRMKARRKELDIPVEDIAAALDVSVATVYRYENGDIEKVPGSVLEPLSKALRTTPAYLMGWDEKKSSADDEGLTRDQIEFVNDFLSLDEADREIVAGLVRQFKHRKRTGNNHDEPPREF